ncbi:FtsK/SpoIIIE domain-containing protein [Mycolicibacterium lutetiense]|uniref:FtsK domain-containing protein n=1 Tax=Mycolicibacterium lutetiense TaxID=1641992 RepID=A0ABS4ZSK1_9MYCO|nr:FtsK/SpoIIIE domain-containing protein [Mycolicibacterium lutetiense]MBP2452497.1 hypothetical protein [Mycolicibacterium lutetiense]
MGFFTGGGYVPSERDRYMRQQKEYDYQRKRADSQHDAARKILDGIPALVEKEKEKVKKQAQATVAGIRKSAETEEKRLLTTPVTQYSGGAHGNPDPIVVWHWRVPMPAAINISVEGVKRTDAGPVLALQPGGGIATEDIIPMMLSTKLGGRSEFAAWAGEVSEVLAEMEQRYPILADIRDDAVFARMLSATGVNRDEKSALEERGAYGTTYSRPRTVVHVPVLTAVDITPEGLELTFAHDDTRRAGDIGGATLDRLRSAFNAGGVHNAKNLVAHDGDDGELILSFRDAPSHFPAAVAPPAVAVVTTKEDSAKAYPGMTWQLGVDARGNVITPKLEKFPHVLVAGSTGGGKSVWIRSAVEALRVQAAQIWLVDGKQSDYIALADLPGVRMVTTEPAAHVVAVSEVFEELQARRAAAAKAKAAGVEKPYEKYAPCVLVIDEFATVRDEWRTHAKKTRGSDEGVIGMIAALLRVGREARCHVVLSSQDIYVENIPQAWQDNLPLFVSLGAPSPRTLAGGAIPEALRDDAQRIGDRISRDTPGRSLYVDRAAFAVREVQSFYGYSPGTTPLTAAPTPEVRAAWAVSEKAAAAVPWLYPRVGIKTEDPSWRDGTLDELADTPTVALTDRTGALLAGREGYDPLRPDWNGAAATGGRKRRAASDFIDVDGDGVDDRDQVPTPPSADSPSPAQVANMTPEEKAAWMRAHAARMGLIPADEETPTPPAPKKTTSRKPASKRGGGDI